MTGLLSINKAWSPNLEADIKLTFAQLQHINVKDGFFG